MFVGMDVVREGPLTGPACRWIGATADIFTFWIKVAKIRIAMRALILVLLSPMKFLDLAFNRLLSQNFMLLPYSVSCARKGQINGRVSTSFAWIMKN
jgi:hypothetical protein